MRFCWCWVKYLAAFYSGVAMVGAVAYVYVRLMHAFGSNLVTGIALAAIMLFASIVFATAMCDSKETK